MTPFPLGGGHSVQKALEIAWRYGTIDGGHHKAWVIDQMVRALVAEDYDNWVRRHNSGEDGPNEFDWDEGVAP